MGEWERRFKLPPSVEWDSHLSQHDSVSTPKGRAKTFFGFHWQTQELLAQFLIDSGFFATGVCVYMHVFVCMHFCSYCIH
jgi:hypothetical protein